MEKVEWEDVQRLVLSGYSRLPHSAYVLWRFQPGGIAQRKQWLAALTERLRRASTHEQEAALSATPPHDPSSTNSDSSLLNGGRPPAINLALTASGLRQFEIEESKLKSFSNEFLEGMAPPRVAKTQIPRRTNLLGDLEASSPEFWDWGGWNENRDIDGLLLLFAADGTSLEALIQSETEAMSSVAYPNPIVLKGHLFEDRREHFGYVDGLSQPIIEGSPKKRTCKGSKKDHISTVKPGEFLLGYLNERRTRISNDQSGATNNSNVETARDVRRNGTYLVFRQLEQDVDAFDAFVSDLAQRLGEKEDWVAARLLGRSKNGEPLVTNGSHAQQNGSGNDFLYYHEDRYGLTCPVGAHIRRANPRDSLGPDPDTALRLSKMHRILRRGRPYGQRRDAKEEQADDAKDERGMLFIALNADIAGQFEMIQHSWLNNPGFEGLYSGTDPISHFAQGGSITIQSRPTNLHIERPAPFVRVRGGAYFFLPGIQALRDIAASA
jgi:Dyp-type peroxidase family